MRMHSWRRLFLALLLAPALTFAAPAGTGVAVAPAKSMRVAKPDVRSEAVIVLDAADSSVLYSRHANRPVPIASITKLMTALVVLDAGQPLDEMIELTVDDRRLERSSFSRLAVGSLISRGDLLHLALMSSENSAAHAVARAYPGGLPACIRAMNAKARPLGRKTARVTDPTGSSSANG